MLRQIINHAKMINQLQFEIIQIVEQQIDILEDVVEYREEIDLEEDQNDIGYQSQINTFCKNHHFLKVLLRLLPDEESYYNYEEIVQNAYKNYSQNQRVQKDFFEKGGIKL